MMWKTFLWIWSTVVEGWKGWSHTRPHFHSLWLLVTALLNIQIQKDFELIIFPGKCPSVYSKTWSVLRILHSPSTHPTLLALLGRMIFNKAHPLSEIIYKAQPAYNSWAKTRGWNAPKVWRWWCTFKHFLCSLPKKEQDLLFNCFITSLF